MNQCVLAACTWRPSEGEMKAASVSWAIVPWYPAILHGRREHASLMTSSYPISSMRATLKMKMISTWLNDVECCGTPKKRRGGAIMGHGASSVGVLCKDDCKASRVWPPAGGGGGGDFVMERPAAPMCSANSG